MNSTGAAGGHEEARPERLETLTTTQVDELEREFNEGNEQQWREHAKSYGWDDNEVQEVWAWFQAKAGGGDHHTSMGGGSTRAV